jgi:spoIIIJ-associated protein
MEDTKNIGPNAENVIEDPLKIEAPQVAESENKEGVTPPEPITPEKIEREVQTVIENIVTFMGIKAMVRAKNTEEGYYANIRSRNADGLLIGKKGMTIVSIQSMVNQIMRHRYPDMHIDVFVDVSGYRKRREAFLKKKALAVAKVVVETKRDMALDILTEREFRMVSKELVPLGTVRVYSIGQTSKKTVIIAPL